MTYQPILFPHDGTPMDQSPVDKGDRVQITDPTQDMTIYQGIFKDAVGEVLWDSDNTGTRPHHMSHGWYIWLMFDEFKRSLILWDPARMRNLTKMMASQKGAPNRRARLQEIISGIIGGDYIKAGCLDRARIIKDLEDAFALSSAQA